MSIETSLHLKEDFHVLADSSHALIERDSSSLLHDETISGDGHLFHGLGLNFQGLIFCQSERTTLKFAHLIQSSLFEPTYEAFLGVSYSDDSDSMFKEVGDCQPKSVSKSDKAKQTTEPVFEHAFSSFPIARDLQKRALL